MIDESEIDSFEGFLQIEGLAGDWYWDPWYRAHEDASWSLVPRLYRREIAEFTEVQITERFRNLAPNRQDSYPDRDDYAGWLMLMRHHGAPTRLLDWTQSLLVAGYFLTRGDMSKSGAIYALNPQKLNDIETGLGLVSFSLNNEQWLARPAFIKANQTYADAKIRTEDKEWVAAVSGQAVDPRMAVQAAAFTIHHRSKADLAAHPRAAEFLMKFVVPPEVKQQIANWLTRMHVNEATLFPDLSGLGRWLAAEFDRGGFSERPV